MALRDVAELLIALADRGGPFGSDGERSLRSLAAALKQRPDSELEEVMKLLKPKAARKPKAGPIEPSAVVDGYLKDFATCVSPAAAQGVLARMTSDKNVKLAETVAIAQGVTGGRSFKTKKIAQEAIRERIQRESWDEGALEIIKARVNR